MYYEAIKSYYQLPCTQVGGEANTWRAFTLVIGCSQMGEKAHQKRPSMGYFQARSQNCEQQLLASSCQSTCPSGRPSIRPHGTTRLPLEDFHETGYLKNFRKSVQKIKLALKSDTKKGHSA
jgi:hypothetical protein